jgi:hypothetical protein
MTNCTRVKLLITELVQGTLLFALIIALIVVGGALFGGEL